MVAPPAETPAPRSCVPGGAKLGCWGGAGGCLLLRAQGERNWGSCFPPLSLLEEQEAGRTPRNKREEACGTRRAVGAGGEGGSQGGRKDGRKVKDWRKQMCTCVWASGPFPRGHGSWWLVFLLFLVLLAVGLFSCGVPCRKEQCIGLQKGL